MGELVKLAVDLLTLLWPLHVVWSWQRGVWFVFGRVWRSVGPGLYPHLPYLMAIKNVSVVEEVYPLSPQTVTLRDGTNLFFSASVTVIVIDAVLAYTKIGHWSETVVEVASAILSQELGNVVPARLDPDRGKRDRVFEEIREEINKEIKKYGLEATALRPNTFVRNVRAYRVMADPAVIGAQQ